MGENNVTQEQDSPLLRDECLVAELYRLGIRHLARFTAVTAQPMPADELLAALARHPQARLNSSLILLFLRHPEMSASVPAALSQLNEPDALTLKFYYQAASYLQRELLPQHSAFSEATST